MQAVVPRFDGDVAFMRGILQRVATGPELSKDIGREEARAAMRLILDGAADPVQAGVFLIALRMKRESDEEMLGVLDAVLESTRRATAEVDQLVDLADPYDGYSRTLPVTPFLPAVLAACGLPVVSHGVRALGPKYGLTHHQVLAACGCAVDLDGAEVARRLADPACGWAYIDQSVFHPSLHALIDLRTRIVKRPVLTTVETLASPVRARGRTHLATGFVHKPYPRIYAMLARAAGFNSALVVRGVEGGVLPSLRATGRAYVLHDGGEAHPVELRAADFSLPEGLRPPTPAAGEGDGLPDLHAALRMTCEQGLAALQGQPGAMRDNLICAGATILWHVGRFPGRAAAADAVRRALDDGSALACLRR